jgi:hypothetical protein
MNRNDENESKEKAALVFHIINLQARIDALTAAVQVLAAGHGSDWDAFHSGLKKCTDAFVQKRLEILEGQSPTEAALIDLRKEAPDIDQSFLDALKPDDEP